MLNLYENRTVKRAVTLHPYQQDFVDSVERSWAQHRKTLAVLPVAGGKTVCAGELAAREVERGGRVLVLAHTIDLVEQFKQSLERHYGLWVTMDGGGHTSDMSPVVVSTVQSCAPRCGTRFSADDFTMVIVDESHRILGGQHLKCVTFFNAKVLGVTATPVRSDQKDLMSVFDDKCFDLPITDLIRDGYLSRIVIKNIPIELRLKTNSVTGDYKDEEVGAAIEPALEACAKAYAENARGKCGAIFLPLVALSKRFASILCSLGIKAIHVDGSMSPEERRAAKKKVESGEADCFCCSLLWSEGFDLRSLNVLMNLRASKSWTLQTQIIGRITRTFDPAIHGPRGTKWKKKTEATILDPLWTTDNYNLLQRPSSFIATNPEEADLIEKHLKKQQKSGGSGDLMEARMEAMAEKENLIRQRLEAMQKRKARTVDAIQFFMDVGKPELVDYEPIARWEMEKPTSRQMEILLKNKFDLTTIKCKGHASKVLDALFKRQDEGFASLAQVKFIQGICNENAQAANALAGASPMNMKFFDAKQFLDRWAPPKPAYGKWKR